MSSTRVPLNLITGASGAGKSTAIHRLLSRRDPAERWAVLINDFGRTKLHRAPEAAEQGVEVREVAGCVCCTAQTALRTALVVLLRRAAPDRLLLEASAAAHPVALLQLLSEPSLATAVELRTSLCVVNSEHARDRRYVENQLYREQIAAADAIYISNSADENAATRTAMQVVLQQSRSAPLACFGEHEPFDIVLLDRVRIDRAPTRSA